MRTIVVLAVVLLTAGCRSEGPTPQTEQRLFLTFAMDRNQCVGKLALDGAPEEKDVAIRTDGTIRWRLQSNGCDPKPTWDVGEFKSKGLTGCSWNVFGKDASGNFAVVTSTDPEERVRRVGTWDGKFCYGVAARWNNRPVDIDPEIDVIKRR